MGRYRRPDLPGTVFHVAARTLRRERLLTPPLRSLALSAIADAIPQSRARLLAVAVMSNHLHLVLQQGHRPLSALMQPLLRRLAHMVQKAHGIEGPIFWRHFLSKPCLDPAHARNAIAYTHLNPVRAGLCRDPADYRWTSHALYAGGPGPLRPELISLQPVLDPALGLPLFARNVRDGDSDLPSAYLAFLEWSLGGDRAMEEEDDDPEAGAAQEDRSPWRDTAWALKLSPLFHAPARPSLQSGDDADPAPAPDLATLARAILAAEAPDVPMASLRGRGGGRQRSRLRHRLIRRLHMAGHRNCDIARFFGLSESAVSKIVRSGGGLGRYG